MPSYYIVEHPRRGVLMEQDFDGDDWRTRWAWSKPRTEAQVFYSRTELALALSRIPEQTRREVRILRHGTWTEVR